jgi:hypothetical protein
MGQDDYRTNVLILQGRGAASAGACTRINCLSPSGGRPEKQEIGLGLYNYRARFYDPSIPTK